MQLQGLVSATGIIYRPLALSVSSGLVATDFTNANFFTLTPNASFTLSNPTGGTSAADGQILIWRITQDSGGGKVMTLGSRFKFGTDLTSATLSTAIGAIDYIACRYLYVDGGSGDRFHVLGLMRGF